MKRLFSVAVVIVAIALIPGITLGAAPFYEGKTIRITVGVSPGGGFDNEARILSRHMPKYKLAAPDGLTFSHFNGGFLFAQALEQPGIEFDARKFGYLGCVAMENAVLWVTKASGITTIDQFMASKTPVKLGGTGIGAYAPDAIIKIWKAVSAMPVQLITPYKGGAEVRLAAEGGELAGSVLSWDAMKSAWKKRFDAGEALVIMQAVTKPRPDLPKVPLDITLAKTDEGRQLIEVGVHLNNTFARPFILGPGVPKDRADILISAFQKTMKDKEFIEECEKAKLPVDPVSGEELEKAVMAAFKTPSTLVAKLKEIMYK
jgi:tripartite-type tricarboxylate transporter receptor subunit TctC